MDDEQPQEKDVHFRYKDGLSSNLGQMNKFSLYFIILHYGIHKEMFIFISLVLVTLKALNQLDKAAVCIMQVEATKYFFEHALPGLLY